jgi:hypothetical protein
MATTRVTLDELGDSIIQTFLANEDELLSSNMPIAGSDNSLTDENKFGGTNFDDNDISARSDITKYGVVGYPHSFDDAYQTIANDAYEGQITALSEGEGNYWNRKAKVLTTDYRNVLAGQTSQEKLKVRNILDQFLHVYDVDEKINSGSQFPNSMKMGRGDFKGSTGSISRYKRSKTYDGEWFRYQGSGYTQMPTDSEQRIAGKKGLIVGQLDARFFRGVGSAIGSGGLADAQDQLVHELFESPDSPFQEFLPNLASILTGQENPELITRISQLYAPGFPRPGEPFRTQKLFNEIIQQNLLLPVNSADSFPNGNPANDSPENVFLNTYTNNRSAKSLESVLDTQVEINKGDGQTTTSNLQNFRRGQIAGTAIEDLEYQDYTLFQGERQRGARNDDQTYVQPFISFKSDSNKLSQNRKDAGFAHNIPNGAFSSDSTYSPNLNSDFMLGSPAVRSFKGKKSKLDAERQTRFGGDSQYFPFCFSTINKDNSYEICYLQGTMSSLNEGYNPTWSPKSYIGRSEQVHTYTFTDRTIDLTFSVFAESGRMLQNVYERVLWLAQQTYPDYDEKKNLKDGPLIAMRVGDLIPYQEGFIKSLSYDWNMLGAGGKWELNTNLHNKRMPQGCTVNLSFQPIHRRVPSRDFNFYSSQLQSLGYAFVADRNMSSAGYNNDNEDYYLQKIEQPRHVENTQRAQLAATITTDSQEDRNSWRPKMTP